MSNNDHALASAIRLLAEKLTQERTESPDPTGNMFEWLTKIKPPYFKG